VACTFALKPLCSFCC